VSQPRAQRLRELLAADGIVRAVGAHDGLTAKLVELTGFEAVWASSFELSASQALPDAGLLGMTQCLDAAEVMDRAVSLPVIADCDTGFGDLLHVAQMARCFARRGIAAVCMEDQTSPKRNSLSGLRHALVPVEEFADKIRVAARNREPGGMLVIARTEALVAGRDLAETLARGRAYAAAGADAVLVHSRDPDAGRVLAFAEAWDLDVPLVAVPTAYPQVSEDELYAAGYRLVIYANQGLRSMVRGVLKTLRELHAGRCAKAVEGDLCSMEDVFALQRVDWGAGEQP